MAHPAPFDFASSYPLFVSEFLGRAHPLFEVSDTLHQRNQAGCE